MIEPAYRYRATVDRVIDGDTYVLDVDLGFRVHAKIEIRLHGWSCAELGTPAGEAAKVRADVMLRGADEIVVESYHDRRSFARWVADVYIDGVLLGAQLEQAGLARAGARVG